MEDDGNVLAEHLLVGGANAEVRAGYVAGDWNHFAEHLRIFPAETVEHLWKWNQFRIVKTGLGLREKKNLLLSAFFSGRQILEK